MNDAKRSSLRNAAVYTAGYVVQRAIGLLLLPFYTRAIAPDEYGALGVLLSLATAAAILFSAGLDIAIFRRYFQLADDPDAQQRFIDSVWRFLVIVPVAGSVLLSIAVWPFVGDQRHVEGLDVFLTLFGAGLTVAATVLPLSVLRAEQDIRRYLILTAVVGLGTPLFTALFVLVLDQGLRGWLIAIVIASGCTLGMAIRIMPWRPTGRMDRRMVRDALRFSLPLLPQSFGHWALQLADRAVIAGIVTASALGVYSLAANIAAPAMMLVWALQQGLMPIYARAGSDPGHQDELMETVVLQTGLVVGITLAGCLLGPSVAELVTPDSYSGAGALIPWIVLGYGFLGLYYIPMNGATLGAGRGTYSWVATTISAGFNIGLLLLFVPAHGVEAAAIAAAAGYLALLVGNGIYAHAGANPIRYDWRRIVPLIGMAAALFAVSRLTAPASHGAELVVNSLWLGMFVVVALFTRLVPLRLGGV